MTANDSNAAASPPSGNRSTVSMKFGGDRSWLLDVVLAIAIFVAGSAVGAAYRRTFNQSGAPQDFAQREFGAAVALACGHGFIDPGYTLTPALDEFLQMKRDRLSCETDLPRVIRPQKPNLTQGLYRYLMSTASLIWMVSGVSWNGLTPMFAAAYGLTLVAAYGLFRLGCGRVVAVMATCALLVSAVHLGYLPYFRDYAKAPFILALMLIMARLAMGPLTVRRSLLLSLAFGVVLGIGFGFRNDLLINLLPWTAVVLLCLPGGLLSNLRLKAACLLVSAAAFVVCAWPILTAYSEGSNTGHVALLGLVTSFDLSLGIAGSIYDVGYVYLDGFVSSLVNSFTYRQYGHPVAYLSKDYDHATIVYILKIVRHFPADILARAYGSIQTILEVPFAAGVHTYAVPNGIQDENVLRFYALQIRFLGLLAGAGMLAVAAALLIISARSMRAAIVLLLFLLYFAGYPAIQFHVRHYFHLEFIAWWALAFLADRAFTAGWRRFGKPGRFHLPAWSDLSPSAARAGSFCLIGPAIVLLPLMTLRWYQTAHVQSLLRDAYLGAERQRLAIVTSPARAGRVVVEVPHLWSDRKADETLSTEYIVAEFSPRRCAAIQVPATFRYQTKADSTDFSHDVAVRVPPGERSTFVFFPAFYNPGWSHFKGVELHTADVECLVNVSRIRKDRVPEVLLDINFTPRWESAKLYQTLVAWETPSDGEDALPKVYTSPPRASWRRDVHPIPFSLAAPQLEYRNANVKNGPGASLIIKGLPDTPTSPVLWLNDQHLPEGATVVAQGEVRTGGISLGIVADGKLAGSAVVSVPGPFVAAVSVPQTGTYAIVLSNRVAGSWVVNHVPAVFARLLNRVPGLARANDVTLTTLGWLLPPKAHPGSSPVREYGGL